LCELAVGWDGYRGQPTRLDIALFAFQTLWRICRPATPAPFLAPLSSGGLQAEWHTSTVEIEITFLAPNNVSAWVADLHTGPNGEERSLTTDFGSLIPWIKRLG
jgi:hypothetical protein